MVAEILKLKGWGRDEIIGVLEDPEEGGQAAYDIRQNLYNILPKCYAGSLGEKGKDFIDNYEWPAWALLNPRMHWSHRKLLLVNAVDMVLAIIDLVADSEEESLKEQDACKATLKNLLHLPPDDLADALLSKDSNTSAAVSRIMREIIAEDFKRAHSSLPAIWLKEMKAPVIWRIAQLGSNPEALTKLVLRNYHCFMAALTFWIDRDDFIDG